MGTVQRRPHGEAMGSVARQPDAARSHRHQRDRQQRARAAASGRCWGRPPYQDLGCLNLGIEQSLCRKIRHRARSLHGRCGAQAPSDEWARVEHLRPGRLQPRMETRAGGQRKS